jgi:hypothetical protein
VSQHPAKSGDNRDLPYNRPRDARLSLPDLVLYGRPGCHLCDETRETLTALLDERRRDGRSTPTLLVRDIESDPAWQRAYFATIPVVEFGDRRLELATSVARLRRLLTDVLDA